MTQPNEAVGGEDIAPVETNTDPFEALAEEWDNDEPKEEEGPEAEADEAEVAEDDEPEVEAEDDTPPIALPPSWKAEEAEHWNTLPRATQEYLAQREGEREKFVQTKAQEAARAREAARNEALQHIRQVQAQTAEQLERYAQQLTVAPPDARLYAVDPQRYAEQLEQYQHFTAQREQAQREAEQARAVEAQYQQALEAQEREAFHQRLQAEVPELLDPATGPKLKSELEAIGRELGYPDDLIFNANVEDIKALRTAAQWKAKAEKWDRAIKKQMERVRAGKNPPPVSKPGMARSPDVQRQAAFSADREAMRRGDQDAARRVLDAMFDPKR